MVENWQVWGPEFRDKSIHEMAAKAATGEVHQPLAKSPCLWPHFYVENLSLFRLSVPLVFLSTFPFPFFFLSSFFLSSLISFIFLPLFITSLFHFYFPFPFPFLFFSFLLPISFPLHLLLSSFHFLFFFLFLSSSSDGWMRCVKRRRAKTLQMPDRIFLMGLQAFAFHRERSAKEVVLTCLPQKPPLWPVRIDFSHLPGEGL